jgi:hypothetical protein
MTAFGKKAPGQQQSQPALVLLKQENGIMSRRAAFEAWPKPRGRPSMRSPTHETCP